jgi:predicted HTH domain antitoxin
MTSFDITLERPISQFVERKSRERRVSAQEAVAELVALGFETLLERLYHRYRSGEISFGRLSQELGVTTWELGHLLEERGWSGHNLPSSS